MHRSVIILVTAFTLIALDNEHAHATANDCADASWVLEKIDTKSDRTTVYLSGKVVVNNRCRTTVSAKGILTCGPKQLNVSIFADRGTQGTDPFFVGVPPGTSTTCELSVELIERMTDSEKAATTRPVDPPTKTAESALSNDIGRPKSPPPVAPATSEAYNPEKVQACLNSPPYLYAVRPSIVCTEMLSNVSTAKNFQDLVGRCENLKRMATSYCLTSSRGGDARSIADSATKLYEDLRALMIKSMQDDMDAMDAAALKRSEDLKKRIMDVGRFAESQKTRTPKYNVKPDFRTDCQGRGLYMIRGSSATGVVCGSNFQSYCRSRGGQYEEQDGDRFCVGAP